MGAEATVTEQIGIIKSYASEAFSAAQAALDGLADIDLPTPGSFSYSPNQLVAATPAVSSHPGTISISGAPTIETADMVQYPVRPSGLTAEIGDILSIEIPEPPTASFPSLDIDAPTASISSPTAWDFSISDILITDDPFIKVAIDRLKSNIQNGGTGLSQAVEDAIWNRDRERSELQLADSLDKMIDDWAKRGFTLPDGHLAHSLAELQKEYLNRNLDRTREIAIKQAELEQTNLFKSLELVVGLASKLIEMLIRYEELVLKCQELTAKYANEYIDIQVRTYASLVEAFKATCTAREILVRAEMTKIEVYRAQIQAQQAIGQLNETTVRIYSEQIRAYSAEVDAYKADVDAMVGLANVQRARVEANKVSVDAWAKTVDANIAQYNGAVDIFRETSRLNVATAELKTKQSEANIRIALAAAEMGAKSLEAQNASVTESAKVRVAAAQGIAQAASNLASGAMAAMAARASVEYQEYKDISR